MCSQWLKVELFTQNRWEKSQVYQLGRVFHMKMSKKSLFLLVLIALIIQNVPVDYLWIRINDSSVLKAERNYSLPVPEAYMTTVNTFLIINSQVWAAVQLLVESYRCAAWMCGNRRHMSHMTGYCIYCSLGLINDILSDGFDSFRTNYCRILMKDDSLGLVDTVR